MKQNSQNLKKPCPHCGKLICAKSPRCKSCANKFRPPRSIASRHSFSEKRKGHNNPMWKGDDVGYISLHEWVRKYKLCPSLCEYCNKVPPHDLANISGDYKRDLDDWEYLCRKCHMTKDGRITKLVGYDKRPKR